ncbi:CocE/NonD family hydrolase [Kitasatospora sp. NPDC018619]|uniref:CocE/NonD family hydrolase n=1 Tax=unclassified Kitasatospora TaxID=2633591 RepID=UPI0037B045F3
MSTSTCAGVPGPAPGCSPSGPPGAAGGPGCGPAARRYAFGPAELRRTGASFGTLASGLGTDVTVDSGPLSDRIAAQPWSNGRVGATGISYGGDTAMLATSLGNHHITAAAAISYDFDPYEDLVRPGGLLIEPQIARYALLLRVLDQAGGTTCETDGRTRELCAESGLTGLQPRPVDGPDGRALLAAGRAGHAHNADLVELASAGARGGPQNRMAGSVGERTQAVEAGRVPVLTRAGWLDAGTGNGVLPPFTGLSDTQDDWIGPWNHGTDRFADPFRPARPLTAPARDENDRRVPDSFDRHARGDARPRRPPTGAVPRFGEGVRRAANPLAGARQSHPAAPPGHGGYAPSSPGRTTAAAAPTRCAWTRPRAPARWTARPPTSAVTRSVAPTAPPSTPDCSATPPPR